MLAAELFGLAGKPVLVFLHGLLGSGKDWCSVVDMLSNEYCCLTVDLPGHGGSKHIDAGDFDYTCDLITRTIEYHLNAANPTHPTFWLIGYSLGARLAMYIAANIGRFDGSMKNRLGGLIIESGHPGLPEQERALRSENDHRWAVRFENGPIIDVLQDWYKQPVFSSLNHAQKQSLVTLRSDNLGVKVATILRATSLSKQPLLTEALKKSGMPLYYLCGSNDPKFSALAIHSGFRFQSVPDAGHNIHAEQPRLFSQLVKQWIPTV